MRECKSKFLQHSVSEGWAVLRRRLLFWPHITEKVYSYIQSLPTGHLDVQQYQCFASGPLPVFIIIKVLLHTARSIHFRMIYGYFCPATAEWRNCYKDWCRHLLPNSWQKKNVLIPALHNSFRDYLDLKSGLSKSKTVTGLTRLSCLDMFSLKENWLCIYSYT